MLQQRQPFILASRSPRRLALFEAVGLKPDVVHGLEVEETLEGGSLNAVAIENARRKWLAAATQLRHESNKWLLCADTVVGVHDAVNGRFEILGKPIDADDARRMLTILSGQQHEVITAYTLGQCLANAPQIQRAISSLVTFRPLSQSEIDDYLQTAEPYDKAGSYGIQGVGGQFINKLEGSESNVMGLPMSEVLQDFVSLEIVGIEQD